MTLKISRVLHAGYLFECGEAQILFDPLFESPFSRNCFAFPSVAFDYAQIRRLRPQAIFISHFHDDHCSLESLQYLSRETPVYIYCFHNEILDMIRSLGFKQVHSIRLNCSVRVGEFEVISRRALDAEVDCLFQIKTAGLNVLNVVDSWIDWETLDLLTREGAWDLVLWPFQTMREFEVLTPSKASPSNGKLPPEWLEQLQKLKPRFVVPSSCQFIHEGWSWYRHSYFPISYASFTKQIESAVAEAEVIRMNPGTSYNLSKSSLSRVEALPWILPVGDQELDYEYDAKASIPSTAEIAARLESSDPRHTARVLRYCQDEIITTFSALNTPEGGYFSKPKTWKLALYDPSGGECVFLYRVHRNVITSLEQRSNAELDWFTEVPILTLYRALEEGESLSSMYVRINDVPFAESVEAELASHDIMEDPLLRCLFEGRVGTYQAAQLKRLHAKVHYGEPI